MKGLIISADRELAVKVKMIVEHMRGGFEMDILNPGDREFCLVDSSEYDFIINPVKPALAHDLVAQIRPFAKTILNRTTDYVSLYRNQKIICIDRNKIIGLEVMERVCSIYTRKSVYKITRTTLNNILELIDDPNIIRCHKSYAVNIKYVHGFSRETPSRWLADFIIDTDFECRISERYMERVIEKFEEYHEVKVNKTIMFC